MTDENNQTKFFLYENWARTKTGQHTVLVKLETRCGSFSPEALYFRKKRGNRFSGSRGQNHRKLILKISTINLHRAGKLKRGKKKIDTSY